jgi:hypothetical protein
MTKSTPPYLRIGELAARSGVSAKALRLYEQRGLLQPAAHSAAGYRLYGSAALAQLGQILLLRRAGFSLAQIGRLLRRVCCVNASPCWNANAASASRPCSRCAGCSTAWFRHPPWTLMNSWRPSQ